MGNCGKIFIGMIFEQSMAGISNCNLLQANLVIKSFERMPHIPYKSTHTQPFVTSVDTSLGRLSLKQ